MRTKNIQCNIRNIISITAFASIVAGIVFVVQYPRTARKYELDSQRILEMQDLEQAIEWYMIRKARDTATTEESSIHE